MKATFRQEWKAGKERILYTSIVLAVVLLGTALTNFIAYKTQNGNVTFFGMFLYTMGLIIGTIGIPIYSLIRGSGNIRSLLFGDTNYLMLLIPEHSWNLLGTKQLLNICEYLIYAIPAAFYLSFMGPTLGLVMKGQVNGIEIGAGQVSSYWESVKHIYHFVFAEHLGVTLQYVLACLILFFVIQSAANCAYAIYSTIMHAKQPNGFLSAVIIFLMFYILIRLGLYGMNNFQLYGDNASATLWTYLWRFALFGLAYFGITAYLMEKRIEV